MASNEVKVDGPKLSTLELADVTAALDALMAQVKRAANTETDEMVKDLREQRFKRLIVLKNRFMSKEFL